MGAEKVKKVLREIAAALGYRVGALELNDTPDATPEELGSSSYTCCLSYTPPAKPRRMRANPSMSCVYGYHTVEHDEVEICAHPPVCVPVDSPAPRQPRRTVRDWQHGDVVETTGKHALPAGSRLVLDKRVVEAVWEAYDSFGGRWYADSESARPVAPPCAGAARSSCSFLPARDWQREIEVGDTVRWADARHAPPASVVAIGFGILFTARPNPKDFGYLAETGKLMGVSHPYLVSKRPDQPGDGFERIGHEAEGIYVLDADGWGRGCPVVVILKIADDERLKFRRVYAVKEA